MAGLLAFDGNAARESLCDINYAITGEDRAGSRPTCESLRVSFSHDLGIYKAHSTHSSIKCCFLRYEVVAAGAGVAAAVVVVVVGGRIFHVRSIVRRI